MRQRSEFRVLSTALPRRQENPNEPCFPPLLFLDLRPPPPDGGFVSSSLSLQSSTVPDRSTTPRSPFQPPHLCSNPAPSYPRVYRAKSRGLCLATHDPGCPLGTDRAKNFLGARGLGCAGRSPAWATPYLVSSLVHTGSGSLPQQVVRVPQIIDGALHLLPLPAQPPSA